ncbi:unnamed protein product [Ectocarpus sp. 12 AP-2014]
MLGVQQGRQRVVLWPVSAILLSLVALLSSMRIVISPRPGRKKEVVSIIYTICLRHTCVVLIGDLVTCYFSPRDSSKPLSDWSATDLVQGHGGRGQAQDRRDGGVPIVHGFEGGLRPTNYVMMLAGSSSFKGKDDMATYDKAMEYPGGFHGEARQSLQAHQAGAEAETENHEERKGVGAAKVARQRDEGAVRALEKAKKTKSDAKTTQRRWRRQKLARLRRPYGKRRNRLSRRRCTCLPRTPARRVWRGASRTGAIRSRSFSFIQHSVFSVSPSRN